MKPYEKPRLVALSLSGNDRLCGDCGHKLYNDEGTAMWILNQFGLGGRLSDGLQHEDFAGVFGTGESGCDAYPVNEYCKFTATDSNHVAWS